MMEKICRNCKHWEENHYIFPPMHKEGNCEHPKLLGIEGYEPDGVHDDGIYSGANIIFNEAFGCVHWEEKKEE